VGVLLSVHQAWKLNAAGQKHEDSLRSCHAEAYAVMRLKTVAM
jgi:hypothetical protein